VDFRRSTQDFQEARLTKNGDPIKAASSGLNSETLPHARFAHTRRLVDAFAAELGRHVTPSMKLQPAPDLSARGNPPSHAAAAAVPPPPPMQARYLAGLHEPDELGLQLRRQAAQVGMEAADVLVALSDGGNGLEGALGVGESAKTRGNPGGYRIRLLR
jgi:hypothetical protein